MALLGDTSGGLCRIKRHEKVSAPVLSPGGPHSCAVADLSRSPCLQSSRGETFLCRGKASSTKGDLYRSTGETLVLERSTEGVLRPSILRFATHHLSPALIRRRSVGHVSNATAESVVARFPPEARCGAMRPHPALSGNFSAFSRRGDKFVKR